MNTMMKFAVPGAALLFTLIFGFWVSKAGKPYNGILFNIHKLIALAAVVTAVMQIVKVSKTVDTAVLVVILLVVAALCVVALFASGALMSMDKLEYTLMLLVHKVASVGVVLALGFVIYLLARGPFG